MKHDWMDKTVKVYSVHRIDGERSESIDYEPRDKYARCDECFCKPCECKPF